MCSVEPFWVNRRTVILDRVRYVNKLTLTSTLSNYVRLWCLSAKMTEFFKSAFSALTGNISGIENDFVGQIVDLGEQKLRVRRVIAEGTVISNR